MPQRRLALSFTFLPSATSPGYSLKTKPINCRKTIFHSPIEGKTDSLRSLTTRITPLSLSFSLCSESHTLRKVRDKILSSNEVPLVEYAMKLTTVVSFVRLSVSSLTRPIYNVVLQRTLSRSNRYYPSIDSFRNSMFAAETRVKFCYELYRNFSDLSLHTFT